MNCKNKCNNDLKCLKCGYHYKNINNVIISNLNINTMLDVEKYCLQREDEDPSERFIIFINHFLLNPNSNLLFVH